MSVKILLDVEGAVSTAGSASLAGRVAGLDAIAVSRLRGAGAIIFGRSNSPAYGDDAQCVSELHGRTNNPWDLQRTSGGSSGGAAAAVATAISPLELGSDTGGSLRIPSHFCGVATHKPTAGTVSTVGHLPPPPGRRRFPDVLTIVGPMARSVKDLRLAMAVLAGTPPYRTSHRNRAAYRLAWSPDGLVPSSNETASVLANVAHAAERAGFHVQEHRPADFDLRRAATLHAELVDICHRRWFQSTTANVQALRRIFASRARLAAQLNGALLGVDAWMMPVTPIVAPLHHPKLTPISVDDVKYDYWDVLTGNCSPLNLTGHPVVTIPVSMSKLGIPIGIQLVAMRNSDAELLDFAEDLEAIIDFRHRPRIPNAPGALIPTSSGALKRA